MIYTRVLPTIVLMKSDGSATALPPTGRPHPARQKRWPPEMLHRMPAVTWIGRWLSSTRFLVEGDSMQPALASRQHLLVDRMAYRFQSPARGDVVVLRDPAQPGVHCVKRIVGLPGEHVRMEMGRVLINESPLDEPYAAGRDVAETPFPRQWLLDQDEYLVLGDQRQHSRDSRAFGPVRRGDVVGRVWLRYWPPGALRRF
ncbi:MAG: signal peptidase I [Dehalococcoidia bacterium]|nr:signal peptidase I [Dehalococcoidia bacterium]